MTGVQTCALPISRRCPDRERLPADGIGILSDFCSYADFERSAAGIWESTGSHDCVNRFPLSFTGSHGNPAVWNRIGLSRYLDCRTRGLAGWSADPLPVFPAYCKETGSSKGGINFTHKEVPRWKRKSH